MSSAGWRTQKSRRIRDRDIAPRRARPDRSSAARGALAQMVAVVGHELRVPLATALLYIRIAEHEMHRHRTGASPLVALAAAQQELLWMEQLVIRTIELEGLGRPIMQPSLVDVGQVVYKTVQRVLLGDVGGRITMTPPRRKLIGWWDQAAVEQIVRNLLTNAVKFGGGRPVRVAVAPLPGGARVTVQDTGVGIRPEDQERIFRRFVGTRTDRSAGLGLGLWLVRELSQAHGGEVTVRSRPGKGSTFTVTLRPLVPPRAPRQPIDANDRLDGAGRGAGAVCEPMGRTDLLAGSLSRAAVAPSGSSPGAPRG
jgi:signal transduction histidine kinase